MDIKCRKTSCKYNDRYSCIAKSINIGKGAECDSFSPDNSKKAIDYSKNIFEADTENYANSRHIKEVKLKCDKCECLFNKDKCCSANGITIIDEGEGETCCSTFVKE